MTINKLNNYHHHHFWAGLEKNVHYGGSRTDVYSIALVNGQLHHHYYHHDDGA